MGIQEKLLIRDLRRILHVLPSWVRWRTYVLLFLMFVLAFFEVLSIFSMSLMAMSIAAPQAILSHRIVQELLQAIPALGQLCNDLRYFTLLTACIVVAFAAIKNGLSALVGWKSAVLGEDIAFSAGSTIMRHFLYSDYMEHMAGNSAAMFQALSWKTTLGQYVVNILSVYTYAITAVALFLTLISATPGVILLCLFIHDIGIRLRINIRIDTKFGFNSGIHHTNDSFLSVCNYLNRGYFIFSARLGIIKLHVKQQASLIYGIRSHFIGSTSLHIDVSQNRIRKLLRSISDIRQNKLASRCTYNRTSDDQIIQLFFCLCQRNWFCCANRDSISRKQHPRCQNGCKNLLTLFEAYHVTLSFVFYYNPKNTIPIIISFLADSNDYASLFRHFLVNFL